MEAEMDRKERTLAEIDLRISGVQAYLDRMNEELEKYHDTGGYITYEVDEKQIKAEIKRLKAARRRVVKDLDPLPKYNWKQDVTFKMPTPVLNKFIHSG